MHPDNKEIARAIFDSFKETFEIRNQPEFKENNPLRSSYFVSLIAQKLHDSFFPGSKKNVQSVQLADGKGKKKRGEWLYDICITSDIEIRFCSGLWKADLLNCKSIFLFPGA